MKTTLSSAEMNWMADVCWPAWVLANGAGLLAADAKQAKCRWVSGRSNRAVLVLVPILSSPEQSLQVAFQAVPIQVFGSLRGCRTPRHVPASALLYCSDTYREYCFRRRLFFSCGFDWLTILAGSRPLTTTLLHLNPIPYWG